MDKKNNKRYGFYNGQMEVKDKIEELNNNGYPGDNLYVIAKSNDQINALGTYPEVHFSTEQDGDWIDKFKEMFGGNYSLRRVFEEMGFSRDEAESFDRRIDSGEIFLFADDEVYNESVGITGVTGAEFSADPAADAEAPKMSRAERRKKLSDNGEESIYLHEEQLEVQKERVQTGEINVNKRIVEEEQHIDVPLERDDVVVERRPVADTGNPDEEIKREPYQVGDELHIPVIEERLIVTKKEVVTEEIVVTKRKINETEHITETLRREEVDIDESDFPVNRKDT